MKGGGMNIIVAVDKAYGIGKDNNLLARLPEDMKRFREITAGTTVVMGRKTYESFPKKPLPNRVNCVISRTVKELDGARVFGSAEEFLEYAKTVSGEIFVLGGGEIYRQLLPYCDKAYITKVNHVFGADTFFPNIDEMTEWKVTETSDIIETNGYEIRFVLYEKV